jgi:hypothetical protein
MATFEERMELRTDLLSGKVPKRIPIYVNFQLDAACELAGVDLFKAHYDPALMDQVYSKLCDTFFADSMPVSNLRFAPAYQALGSKNWVMGSKGNMQHPEIEPMQVEEYDAYIEDPYGFMMTTILPRICGVLDTDDPTLKAVNLAKAYQQYNKCVAEQGAVIGKLVKKHGYGPGLITGTLLAAPFDFIADQLRGFKAITMDLRRCPDKVGAAVEATLPLMMKQATLQRVKPGSSCFIPLHLAPYINMKFFEKYYWPTLYKMVWDLDKMGIACLLFAEEDFTRYADHLAQLPESSVFIFEYGDPAEIKEKVGKNHVISGFFDPTITLTRSKEDCLDAVKRLCDTCGPGGRFAFRFDKGVISMTSVDVSKLQACLEWVRDNTDYR